MRTSTHIRNLARLSARPLRHHQKRNYYHGTPNERAAKSILKHGINPEHVEVKRGTLAPQPGHVYITTDPEYALTYALQSRDGYGYLFVIPGSELRDIHPDEDNVGELIHDGTLDWLNELAEEALEGVGPETPRKMGLRSDLEWEELDRRTQDAYLRRYDRVPDLSDIDDKIRLEDFLQDNARYDDIDWWDTEDTTLLELVKDGDYAAWAEAGLILIDWMTPEQELEVIQEAPNISHKGSLKPSECWKVPGGAKVKRNLSNLRQVAEQIL